MAENLQNKNVGANCGSPATEESISSNSHYPSRKLLRLKGYDYSEDAAYFITVCCHKKKHLFGKISKGKMYLNQYGKIVEEEWLKSQTLRKNIVLDEYMVMPNHFHAIIIFNKFLHRDTNEESHTVCQTGEPQFAPTLGSVMKAFKQAVTMRIRVTGYNEAVWQRGYYDHIIRNIHDFRATSAYIIDNPINWSFDRHNLTAQNI